LDNTLNTKCVLSETLR